MSLALFLDDLAQSGIQLREEEGRLRFRAPEGALTPAWREAIAARREALLLHLQGRAPEPELLRVPVSDVQGELWMFDQIQGPNTTYNIPLGLRLDGPLDAVALRGALDDLVRRHQALRCRFTEEGLEILRDLAAPWEVVEVEDPGPPILELAGRPFDLGRAPLMACRLIRLGPQAHVLALNFHHIVVDGWSCALILRELGAAYEARLAGRSASLPPLAWQFSDWLVWQERILADGTLDGDRAYWRQRLEGAPRGLTLPPDFPRPPRRNHLGASVHLVLDAPTTARLRARARAWAASLNHLTLLATASLLALTSGSRDLVLGLASANRARRELEPIVGMFVNLLPLRLVLEPGLPLAEAVARVRQAVAEALLHGQLPLGALAREGGADPNALFQVAFDAMPSLGEDLAFGGLEVNALELCKESGVAKLDASFYLEEQGGSLVIHVEYATELYRPATVQAWAGAFKALLDAMLERPGGSLGDAERDAGLSLEGLP